MSEVAPAAPVAATPAAPAAPAAPSAPAPAPAADGNSAVQNNAEQAPAAKPEGENPETPEQAAKRQGRRFERRLSAAFRREAEARAHAANLEKELAQYRQPKGEPGAPKLEDFKDIEDYATAKANFERDKALKERDTKQRTETQQQESARLVQSWEERSERGAAKYDDFEDVVGEIQPTTPWSVAVMRCDNGEEVAYHLGKNIEAAKKIAKLHPVDQFIEIGRLSAKLAAEPPKARVASKAPAPINPLPGTSPADASTPAETDDMGTWFRKRQKQVHGARR